MMPKNIGSKLALILIIVVIGIVVSINIAGNNESSTQNQLSNNNQINEEIPTNQNEQLDTVSTDSNTNTEHESGTICRKKITIKLGILGILIA